MIDLHNHILPGVDDGARDLIEALEMARLAVAVGTNAMAATPHRFWQGRDTQIGWVEERVAEFQGELDQRGIALTIVPGLEIPLVGPDVAAKAADGTLPRLGGAAGTHVLVEPPFDRAPMNAIITLEAIMDASLTPILAHPERCAEIQKHLAFVETAASLGVILQLTSGSIMGHFGSSAQRTAREIAEHGEWKIIIASDAHWSDDRTPGYLRQAANTVASWIGDSDRADAMVTSVPLSCLPAEMRAHS